MCLTLLGRRNEECLMKTVSLSCYQQNLVKVWKYSAKSSVSHEKNWRDDLNPSSGSTPVQRTKNWLEIKPFCNYIYVSNCWQLVESKKVDICPVSNRSLWFEGQGPGGDSLAIELMKVLSSTHAEQSVEFGLCLYTVRGHHGVLGLCLVVLCECIAGFWLSGTALVIVRFLTKLFSHV